MSRLVRQKTETENWKCSKCKAIEDKFNHTSNMEEVKEKILNMDSVEENNLESSLFLAAEVGNALLHENTELKHNIKELHFKNSTLTLEIQELKNFKNFQAEYQLQIEELQNEKEIILDKYNTLVEKVNLLENQLTKEKQMRTDLQKIFEEQDTDKEETISKYETTIKNLQSKFEHHIQSRPTIDINHSDMKPTGNKETQTSKENSTNPNIFVLTELAKMKTRQDSIEDSMKTIQAQLHSLTLYQNTISREPHIKGHEHTSSNTDTNSCSMIKSRLFISRSRNRTTNNTKIPVQTVDTNKSHKKGHRKTTTSPGCSSKTKNPEEPQKTLQIQDKTETFPKNHHAPPMTAKKLGPEESWEDFYNKHIQEAIRTQQQLSGLTKKCKQSYFLDLLNKTQSKMKQSALKEQSQ